MDTTITLNGRRINIEFHGVIRLTVDDEAWGTVEFDGGIGGLTKKMVDSAVECTFERLVQYGVAKDEHKPAIEDAVRKVMPLPGFICTKPPTVQDLLGKFRGWQDRSDHSHPGYKLHGSTINLYSDGSGDIVVLFLPEVAGGFINKMTSLLHPETVSFGFEHLGELLELLDKPFGVADIVASREMAASD